MAVGGGRFDDEVDDPLAGLEGWAAAARAREAAEARVRERWLRTQAEEGAQLSAVLAGMVERAAAVTVTTIAGRHVAGQLSGVGQDFVALVLPGGRRHLVALDALAWLRPAPDDRRRRPEPALGPDEAADLDDGSVPPAAALVDVLAHAVAQRPRVGVQTEGASLTGELRAVGVDVVALEIAGDPPGLAYVRLRSIYEISFLDSG